MITKFYDIRQHSLNAYDDVSWEDKCTSLLNDEEDMWTFTGYGESSTTKYIVSSLKQPTTTRMFYMQLD